MIDDKEEIITNLKIEYDSLFENTKQGIIHYSHWLENKLASHLSQHREGWTDEGMKAKAKKFLKEKSIRDTIYGGMPDVWIKGGLSDMMVSFLHSLPPKTNREGELAEFTQQDGFVFYPEHGTWETPEGKYETTTELFNSPEFQQYLKDKK